MDEDPGRGITIYEVWRRLQELIRQVDGLAGFFVREEVYNARHKAIQDRMSTIEERLNERADTAEERLDAAERTNQFYFRALLFSVLAPIIVGLVILYVTGSS